MRAPYPDSTIKDAVKHYLGGESATIVGQRYGMCMSTVLRAVKRMGGKTRTTSEALRQYSIDKDFFAKIDAHSKAQILGFIYADGCLTKRTETNARLQIGLSPIDTDYLEWMSKTMNSDKPLYPVQTTGNDGTYRESIWLTTSQPEIIRDIQRLGVTPRKSLTAPFPTTDQVPLVYMPSFILGAFEGDGCIHLGRCRKGPTLKAEVTIVGSVPFIEGASAYLSTMGIRNKVSKRDTKDGKSQIAYVHVNTVEGVMRFYDLVYPNASYRMERKHAKFLQYKAQYDEVVIDGVKEYHLKQRKPISDEGKKRIGDAARARGRALGKWIHIKSPDGVVYHASGIRPFCREMHIHRGHIGAIAAGRGPSVSHLGWRRPSGEEVVTATTTDTLVTKDYR